MQQLHHDGRDRDRVMNDNRYTPNAALNVLFGAEAIACLQDGNVAGRDVHYPGSIRPELFKSTRHQLYRNDVTKPCRRSAVD